MARSSGALSAEDAETFRLWYARIRKRFKDKDGASLVVAMLAARASTALPLRKRDWFMQVQNAAVPLGRKKAIELCLRIANQTGRYNDPLLRVNDNIIRLLIDTPDDPFVVIGRGQARRLYRAIVAGLESRGTPVGDDARTFLGEYLSRFESLERNFWEIREALSVFRARYQHWGWWQLVRASNVRYKGGSYGKYAATLAEARSKAEGHKGAAQFSLLTLMARLHEEAKGMKFETRDRAPID